MSFQAGQTMRKQLLELAEAVGVAVQTTTGIDLPTNAYELDKLKRKYNEGLRLMASAKPSGWYCLRPTVTITLTTDTAAANVLDGDISRYRLPANVGGQPVGEWTWVASSGNLQGSCQSVSWGEVTRGLNSFVGGGLPEKVAITPLLEHAADGTDRTVFQIRVFPRPNQEYVLSAEFNTSVDAMTELDSCHPFGALHDSAVLAAAKWAWVKDDTTDTRRADWMIDFLGADGTGDTGGLLLKSKQIDDETAPNQIASLLDAVYTGPVFMMTPPESVINGVTYTGA